VVSQELESVMHIFLATSADNPHTVKIKEKLHSLGHTYYHFLDGDVKLDYDDIHHNLRNENPTLQAALLKHPRIEMACASNTNAVRESDIFMLAEPASKGCYMEYGMAFALRKPTILIVTPEYQIGVMDSMFKYTSSIELLDKTLKFIRA